MVKKRISKKVIKIIQNYVRRLIKEDKIPVDKIIVFGSYVRGTSSKWSDIDICLVSPKFEDSLETLEYLLCKRRREEVEYGLEPIGFSPKDFQEGNSLVQEIKRTGISVTV